VITINGVVYSLGFLERQNLVNFKIEGEIIMQRTEVDKKIETVH
jgi:hypothetical protein